MKVVPVTPTDAAAAGAAAVVVVIEGFAVVVTGQTW